VENFVNSSVCGWKKFLFQHEAETVVDGEMQFLDEIDLAGGCHDGDIGKREHFAAGAAGEGEGFGPEGAGGGEGVEDVAGIARGGDADDDVFGAGEAENELGVGVFFVAVVGKGGAGRGEAREWDDGERSLELTGERFSEGGLESGSERAFLSEAFEEFARPVFGIGGTAAVAADEDFSPGAKAVAKEVESSLDGWCGSFQSGCSF